MLKFLVLLMTFLFILSPTEANSLLPFKQMDPLLHQALLEKDLPALYKHIDLSGIVRSKVRKFSQKAGQEKDLRSKILSKGVGLTEPVLTRIISEIVVKEFKVTPRAVVQSYLNHLKIQGIGEKGNIGYAYGMFLGKPFYLSAVKHNGDWLIIGAESAVIDHEIDYLLKALRKEKK